MITDFLFYNVSAVINPVRNTRFVIMVLHVLDIAQEPYQAGI